MKGGREVDRFLKTRIVESVARTGAQNYEGKRFRNSIDTEKPRLDHLLVRRKNLCYKN